MQIKDLLLQVLIILAPIFAFQMIGAERVERFQEKKKGWFIFFLMVIPVLLCMTFPIIPAAGFRYDLKMVLLIMATLYGGKRVGFGLFLVSLFYRYQWGGQGMVLSTVVSLATILLCALSSHWFLGSVSKKRIEIATLLSIASVIISISVNASTGKLGSIISFYILFIWIQLMCTIFAIYLIENIRESFLLKLEIQQSEKLRLLGHLTGAFAHEIRNPMQVNQGFLQLLSEEPISDKAKGYIDICLKEMARANEIITDYLAFAKPVSQELEPVEVAQQLRVISNIVMSYALMNNVSIDLKVTEDCWILASGPKLKQSLINILKNGIEAMPEGGTLRIRCSSDTQNVMIHISDHGIGMTKDEVKRLGTPFYTLKEKGTGLGLMVAYRILETFKGNIRVTSEKGKGTTFSLLFPRYVREEIDVVVDQVVIHD
jgi:two-component system, sporulation sensor kinase B